jgi:hypothetical protein
MGAIFDEVIGPDVIGTLRPQPDIRSDNGPEFVAKAVQEWIEKRATT